jgi:hypothetical protein
MHTQKIVGLTDMWTPHVILSLPFFFLPSLFLSLSSLPFGWPQGARATEAGAAVVGGQSGGDRGT